MRLIFLISMLLAMNSKLFSQDLAQKYYINYEQHPGELVLNDSQVVKGIFQYANWAFSVWNFKYYSEAGKLLGRYKVTEIKKITLAGSDTSLSKKDSTCFVRIGHSTLYRQLTFGTIKIYDELIDVNEREGLIFYNLYVLEKNKLKTFHSEDKILRYIEAKLKQKNINKSFQSINEAIRYLNDSDI